MQKPLIKLNITFFILILFITDNNAQSNLRFGYGFEAGISSLGLVNKNPYGISNLQKWDISIFKYISIKDHSATKIGLRWQYFDGFNSVYERNHVCLSMGGDLPTSYHVTVSVDGPSLGVFIDHSFSYQIKGIRLYAGFELNPQWILKTERWYNCTVLIEEDSIDMKRLSIFIAGKTGVAFKIVKTELYLEYKHEFSLRKTYKVSEDTVLDSGLEDYRHMGFGLHLGLKF